MPSIETPEDIRTAGLKVLEERLGRTGMLRFLQQFDRGQGDYARERHAWVDATTAEEIKGRLKSLRARKPNPRRRAKRSGQ